MKRTELMPWVLAIVLVAAAAVLLKFGPDIPSAHASESTPTAPAGDEGCP